MNYRENKRNRIKKVGESLEELINAKIAKYVRNFAKQREVEIKRVYNEHNYSLRRVDVVFTDDINQSMPIKNLPVNLPYHITVNDKAFLFYFDKPTNGWIGNLITYSDIVSGGTVNWNDITNIPTTLEGYGIKQEIKDLMGRSHYVGGGLITDPNIEVWIQPGELLEGEGGIQGLMQSMDLEQPMGNIITQSDDDGDDDDDVIIDLTKKYK